MSGIQERGVGPMSGIWGSGGWSQCIIADDHMGNRMTDTCENITFPQLRFAGGKNNVFMKFVQCHCYRRRTYIVDTPACLHANLTSARFNFADIEIVSRHIIVCTLSKSKYFNLKQSLKLKHD